MNYTCVICNWEGYYNRVGIHLKSHNLTIKEYHDKYINTNKNCDVCSVCGIGKLKLLSLKDGYRKSCSFKCNRQLMLNKYPNILSENGKKEISRRVSNDPNYQSKVGSLGGLKSLQSSNTFRKENMGMSKTAYLLYSHPNFASLNPIVEDRRFFHSCHGGISIDFSLPDYLLAIEIDGTTGGFSHNIIKDQQRDQWLLDTHGWRTIRFTNEEIKRDINSVINKIGEILNEISRTETHSL